MSDKYNMTLDQFIRERQSHESCMQFWINSDEDAVILDIDPDGEMTLMSISLVTEKVYEYPEDEDKKNCQAWGVPFEDLAKFVDAVRAIKGAKDR